jgi:anti-sigma factor RsiW
MMDARPTVRHRAIELYSERENVTVDAFLNILRDEDFKRGMTGTRQRIAEIIGEQFPRQWIPRLKRQLTSDEGILPALKLVRHVHRETGETKILELIREDLVRIAKAGKAKRAPLAAYLLVQLPGALEDEAIVEVIEETVSAPLPRYAYLERIVRSDPSKHVGFLLDHFYASEGAPETFPIRLMAGAGLWAAEHGSGGAKPATGSESDAGKSSS